MDTSYLKSYKTNLAPWSANLSEELLTKNSVPQIRKPKPVYPTITGSFGYAARPPSVQLSMLQSSALMTSTTNMQHIPMAASLPATTFHPGQIKMSAAANPGLPRVLPVPATVPGMIPQPPSAVAPRHLSQVPGMGYLPHYIVTPKFPSGKKLFRCPQCRYVTDRKNNLKRHIGTMHQDCGKVLECCDVVFPSKASLRDHVVLFHRSGYKCRFCGRNFCRKALLKRHRVVHTGQKDYVCTICDYSTNDLVQIEEHKKMHQMRVQGRDNATPPSEVVKPGLDPFAWNTMYWNLFGMDANEHSWLKSYPTQPGVSGNNHLTMFPDRLKATHETDTNTYELDMNDRNSPDKSEDTPENALQVSVPSKEEDPSSRALFSHRLCPFPYKCSNCAKTFLLQTNLAEHANTCVKTQPAPSRPLKFFQDSSMPMAGPHLDVEHLSPHGPACMDTLLMIGTMKEKRLEKDTEMEEEEEDEDEEEALDLSLTSARFRE